MAGRDVRVNRILYETGKKHNLDKNVMDDFWKSTFRAIKQVMEDRVQGDLSTHKNIFVKGLGTFYTEKYES